eukprot:scaffold8224_cov118-Isochrysis_galbana.AAC.9
MSDADNGQRLGAILARLRAVAASTSAQQGRYPAGELTASTAQLDTLSALAQYSRQPANQPEGLAGAVQPPVALEVAARMAVLRQILASDPGASPVESDKGRAQLHDLESVAVSGPDPCTAPSNGADRVRCLKHIGILPIRVNARRRRQIWLRRFRVGRVGHPQGGSAGERSALPPPPYPDYPRSHNHSRSGVG